MESKKVEVTLVTSKYFGQYGVIQKVTPKKFKIRFWDTGEEAYLRQTSVAVLPHYSPHQDRKHSIPTDTPANENKRTKAKVQGVDHAVSQLLESVEGDGVTRDEWEGIVDKIGKMFI